jgi:hypothetical protein
MKSDDNDRLRSTANRQTDDDLAPMAVPALPGVIYFVGGNVLSEVYAVGRLQYWLAAACGGKSPQVVAQRPTSGPWLAVGYVAAAAIGLNDSASKALGDEGFTFRCSGSGGGCAVSGGGPSALRGTMYGVYELLERWGFRFFAWDTIIIPQCPTTLLLPSGAQNLTIVPDFTYRDVSSQAICLLLMAPGDLWPLV